jgi:hypothetical protein
LALKKKKKVEKEEMKSDTGRKRYREGGRESRNPPSLFKQNRKDESTFKY